MGALKKYYLTNQDDQSRVDIEELIIIGRDQFPHDLKMSKKHCQISLNDNVISIKDLNSKNKTWINSEEIPANRSIKLHLNDKIKIGRTEFLLETDGLKDLDSTDTRKSASDFTFILDNISGCLLYTSPSPRDRQKSRMPSSA